MFLILLICGLAHATTETHVESFEFRSDHGDWLIVHLDRAVNLSAVAPEDLTFYPSANLGEGSMIERSLAASDQIRIHLGKGWKLSLHKTYLPGKSSPSPTLLLGIRGVTSILNAERGLPVSSLPEKWKAFIAPRERDRPELRPFYGQLHSHTRFSDGKSTPDDAYAQARQSGLDFFSVTDHYEQIWLKQGHWAQEKSLADAANESGSFVALYGFEWGGSLTTRGWVNHINVMGLLHLPPLLRFSRLNDVYRVVGNAHEPVVGLFNHPEDKPFGFFPKNNWNGLNYVESANRGMRLMRAQPDELDNEFAGYIPALDHGWRLAPETDEDTHSGHFARSARRTGVWADALTREGILQGMRNLNTFVTNKPGARLKLVADGEWLMGSTLYGPGEHRLQVEISSIGDTTVKQIELIGIRGQVIETRRGASLGEFLVNPEFDAYYLARVELSDGTRMISSPIFIDR